MYNSCVYLDVSFGRDEVSQALNGAHQEGAMFLQGLDHKIIRHIFIGSPIKKRRDIYVCYVSFMWRV